MKLETERLVLRELTIQDLENLHQILSDPESMKHYPEPFTHEKSKQWIEWNLDHYQTYGFGLWAVIRKESNLLIGDCGITMQKINGNLEPEIGYLKRPFLRRGFSPLDALSRVPAVLTLAMPLSSQHPHTSTGSLVPLTPSPAARLLPPDSASKTAVTARR